MPKNYNIISKTITTLGAGTGVAVGSSVAAGLTRYVTFIKVVQTVPTGNKGSKMWFCSSTAALSASSTTLADARMKFMVLIPSAVGAKKAVAIPESPDQENPLFTIAASNFLTVRGSKAAATSHHARCSYSIMTSEVIK